VTHIRSTVVRNASPARVKELYHLARKQLGHDAHNVVDAITLRHVGRYMFARNFVAGLRTLDVACGSGYGSMILDNVASYQGIDIDKTAIKTARRNFPGQAFTHGSIYSLPQSDGDVGAVTSFETLEHVDNPIAAIDEVARVLTSSCSYSPGRVGLVPTHAGATTPL